MPKVQSKKKLLKGRYYWHRDSSLYGLHPSYIYKKNDKKNRYLIVCFTSSAGKKRTLLNKNINPNSKDKCYVLNTPQVSKRKSFGKELIGYKVVDNRDKAVIKNIKNKKRK